MEGDKTAGIECKVRNQGPGIKNYTPVDGNCEKRNGGALTVDSSTTEASVDDCAKNCRDYPTNYCPAFGYMGNPKACQTSSFTSDECQAKCDEDATCSAYQYNAGDKGICRLYFNPNMTSDGLASPDYNCMIKVLDQAQEEAAANAWYDDPWGNWVKVYLFELCKIFFGNVEAYLLKYVLKYGTQFLTGHDF